MNKQNVKPKPNFKSIIATTAAIIIQNYWRSYRNHKLNRTEDQCGDTVLEVIRRKIETNTTAINDKTHYNFANSVSMIDNDQTEMQKQNNDNEVILKDVSVGSADNKWITENDDQGIFHLFYKLIEHQYNDSPTPKNKMVRLLQPNEFSKVFEIQHKAIELRERAELKAIDKMLKKKNVSPNTHQQRRHHLEVWATRQKEKLDKNKKEFKNIFYKTIEMVENTRNKEHIKKLMATSKAKRPDIWSDYGNSSLWSFSSRSHKNKNNQNASFSSYQYVKLFKPAVDLSLESLSLANDNQNISNDKISNKHPENVRNNDLIKIDNGCDNIRKEITFEVLNQNKQHNEVSKNEDNFINKYEKPISKVIDYGNDIQRHGLITNDESSGINFVILL